MSAVPITADLNTPPKLIAYMADLLQTAAPEAVTAVGGRHALTVGINHDDGSTTSFRVAVEPFGGPNAGWSL